MGVPIAIVKSGGTPLGKEIELMSLEVHRELNKIPEAKLTLLDGSVAKRKFVVSNSEFFALGKSISIALGEGNKGDDAAIIVFEGMVVRHAVETSGEGGSMLRVELKDAAFKLTRQRKSAVFTKKRDDEAIAELVKKAGGLTSDVDACKVTHDELVQYYASDWDFIVSRADVQGMLVDVHLGKVSVKPMAIGAVKRKLDYGLDDTGDLSLELDGSQQWSEVSSVGWDLEKHALGEPELGKDPAIKVGNFDASAIAKDLAKGLGGKQNTLFHPAPHAAKELETWASARLLRSRLALLRGTAVVDGDATLAPLQTVDILGVGERFDGKALISGITHKVDHDGWKTELQLGLASDWFSRQPDIAEVPAGGLLPAVHGLQIAKVAGFEADPLGEHRIKIQLPALDENKGVVWARMARPDAGPDRGFVFWPEPEDEVVIGFLDGDPRQAIVLGALHGKPSLPEHLAPSDTNDMRVLISRSGSFLRFDDKLKQIVISTPAGHTIKLDDDGKALSIIDQHGNNITMNDKGITIESGSDFTIDAAGKVVIKGSTVDVQ